MSYCVNCGVELELSAKKCPLCNTPVWNPRELEKLGLQGQALMPDGSPFSREQESFSGEQGPFPREQSPFPREQSPFPREQSPFPLEKGKVEAANKKDVGLLISMVVLATAATCGILNALVFRGSLWSLAVIGACAVLWVILIPVMIYTKQPIYVSLLYDGAVVVLYLYMLALQVGSKEWFWGLGLPITGLVTVLAEVFALCVCKFPRSFLTVALYVFTGIGLLCMGLEMLIDLYLAGEIALSWSAVVLTICAILDIALITMLSRRRLRNEVRRRLHF